MENRLVGTVIDIELKNKKAAQGILLKSDDNGLLILTKKNTKKILQKNIERINPNKDLEPSDINAKFEEVLAKYKQ